MAIDDVLEQVVADTWDREAFAEEFRKQQEADLLRQQVSIAIREGDFERALQIADELADGGGDEAQALATQIRNAIGWRKLFSLATSEADADEAVAQFERLIEPVAADPDEVNEATWRVVQMAESGAGVSDKLLAAAATAAEGALVEGHPQGSILDTIAHLYHLRGDLDGAIAVQERAVEADLRPGDEGLRDTIAAYLEALRAEKAAAEPTDEADAAAEEEEPVAAES